VFSKLGASSASPAPRCRHRGLTDRQKGVLPPAVAEMLETLTALLKRFEDV
jgi:hypothetical protein